MWHLFYTLKLCFYDCFLVLILLLETFLLILQINPRSYNRQFPFQWLCKKWASKASKKMQVVGKLPRCVLPRYPRPLGTALTRDSRPPGTALPRDPRLLLVRRNHTSEDLWTNYEQAKSWLRCKVRFLAYFRLVWSVIFNICTFSSPCFFHYLLADCLLVTTAGVFPCERGLFT
jgi:hypothetical protein